MEKPRDYDNVQGYGDYAKLPAGGYVCRIMSVEETVSKAKGSQMIVISLDIAEGEYKDFYAARYRNDNRPNKKWGCMAYQLIYDTKKTNSTNPGFKTFNTSVEESNNGYMTQWGVNYAAALKGKLVGVLFGREEFVANDGSHRWNTKPMFFRSVDTIRSGKYETPKDKPLYDNPASNYAPAPVQNYSAASYPSDLPDFEEVVSASDLPF